MSAPPGYNETASMLPDAGGAIRAMQGGFSASPYTGGVTAENSLLPKVPEAVAPITNYSGGAAPEAVPVAVASTFVRDSNAVPAAVIPNAVVPNTVPNVPVAASVPAASVSAAPVAAAPVSTASVAAAPQSSTNVPLIVQGLNSNPTSQAAIGVVATLAASASHNSSDSNPNSIVADAGNNIGIMNNVEEDEAVNGEAVNGKGANGEGANGEKAKSEENDEDTKSIKVYGKEYKLTPPNMPNKAWNELMTNLGLDALSAEDQQEFKDMIYEDSTCIEKDLPISTSIKCEATRKFIFKVAEKLLDTPALNSSGTKIEIKFDPEKQVESLSIKNIGVLSEPKPESKAEEPVKKADEPVVPPAAPAVPAAEKASAPPAAPPAVGKPPKMAGGKLRGKKHRTIRKQK